MPSNLKFNIKLPKGYTITVERLGHGNYNVDVHRRTWIPGIHRYVFGVANIQPSDIGRYLELFIKACAD